MSIPTSAAALREMLAEFNDEIRRAEVVLDRLGDQWGVDTMTETLPTQIGAAVVARGVSVSYSTQITESLTKEFRLMRRRIAAAGDSLAEATRAADAAESTLTAAETAARNAGDARFTI